MTEEQLKWFKALKVGDEVAVVSGHGAPNERDLEEMADWIRERV